jgi:hypothetical protein
VTPSFDRTWGPLSASFRGQKGGNHVELSLVNELMLCDKFKQVFVASDFKNGITGHLGVSTEGCHHLQYWLFQSNASRQ